MRFAPLLSIAESPLGGRSFRPEPDPPIATVDQKYGTETGILDLDRVGGNSAAIAVA